MVTCKQGRRGGSIGGRTGGRRGGRGGGTGGRRGGRTGGGRGGRTGGGRGGRTGGRRGGRAGCSRVMEEGVNEGGFDEMQSQVIDEEMKVSDEPKLYTIEVVQTLKWHDTAGDLLSSGYTDKDVLKALNEQVLTVEVLNEEEDAEVVDHDVDMSDEIEESEFEEKSEDTEISDYEEMSEGTESEVGEEDHDVELNVDDQEDHDVEMNVDDQEGQEDHDVHDVQDVNDVQENELDVNDVQPEGPPVEHDVPQVEHQVHPGLVPARHRRFRGNSERINNNKLRRRVFGPGATSDDPVALE